MLRDPRDAQAGAGVRGGDLFATPVRAGRRGLLTIESLSAEEIVDYLDAAEGFLSSPGGGKAASLDLLRGRTVINLFLEPSTRTRISFELAARRLSAEAINISGSTSSTVKGETLVDTARNLEAMSPDVIVIRDTASGSPELVARHVGAHVINAGDGWHEHPTQALLDASTIRAAKGKVAGLRVAIVGDIAHSRVARSNLHCLRKLGAEVVVSGPRTMMPPGIEALGCQVARRLEDAVAGADVIMMLRIQHERGASPMLPSLREYSRTFGLTLEKLALAAPDAIVMHPGPVNRGVEITAEVADGPRSVILEQVERGVAVRMAVLCRLLGVAPPAARARA